MSMQETPATPPGSFAAAPESEDEKKTCWKLADLGPEGLGGWMQKASRQSTPATQSPKSDKDTFLNDSTSDSGYGDDHCGLNTDTTESNISGEMPWSPESTLEAEQDTHIDPQISYIVKNTFISAEIINGRVRRSKSAPVFDALYDTDEEEEQACIRLPSKAESWSMFPGNNAVPARQPTV